MRAVGDEQAALHVDALLLQLLDLFEQAGQVQHNTVAHHAHGLLAQDAGGHQVQRIAVSGVIIDRVPGVGTTLRV